MKVNVDMTIEVSDTQRVQIANVLDGKVSRRQATRQELKDFLWENGGSWSTALAYDYKVLTGEEPEPEQGEQLTLEDLL